MTSLFTPAQMTELVADRRKIREKKMADRLEPFVDRAVKFYAEQVRPASQRILDDLKYSNWSFAFEFNSYDFGALKGREFRLKSSTSDMRGLTARQVIYERDHCGAMFAALRPDGEPCAANVDLVSMWVLYRHTDFRQRLLAELGLDPLHFEFKNLSKFAPVEDRLFAGDEIIEYRNKVHLVYKQFPKKKPADPVCSLGEISVQPPDPTPSDTECREDHACCSEIQRLGYKNCLIFVDPTIPTPQFESKLIRDTTSCKQGHKCCVMINRLRYVACWDRDVYEFLYGSRHND